MRLAAGAIALAAGLLAACSAPADDTQSAAVREVGVLAIEPRALATRLDSGEDIQLIDVRTPEEFAEGHIAGAINIPDDDFDPAALPDVGGAERMLYCRSDRRSGIAAKRLAEAENATVVHMKGGILAWEKAGLPVQR